MAYNGTWWDKKTPENILRRKEGRLPVGVWMEGNKKMTKCPDCNQRVRINKPIVGDLHICC